MTKKQRLLQKIKNLLAEKGATENNRLEHDIYLLRSHYADDNNAWYGKIQSLWLANDGTPKCHIWYWGMGVDNDLNALTYTNLGFVLEYLVNGYVIQ